MALAFVLAAFLLAGTLRAPTASAQVDDSWRLVEQASFAVVFCEGPDGIPGNADDRPKNNPTAAGTGTISYDESAGTWDVVASLTDIRAGAYRLVIGRFGSTERTVLGEFAAVDDPISPADHLDVAVQATGLVVEAVDQYSVLEVERSGPPWGGGGACTGDHGGRAGGDGGQCGDDDGDGGCKGGDENGGSACEGGDEGAEHGEGGCGGGAGTHWRAELRARFSLSRVATVTLRQDVISSGIAPAPDGMQYELALRCSDQDEARTVRLIAGGAAQFEVVRGAVCSVTQSPVDGSIVSGLIMDRLIEFDTVVAVTNLYHQQPPPPDGAEPAEGEVTGPGGLQIHGTLDVPSDGTALLWANAADTIRVEVPAGAVRAYRQVHLTVGEVGLEDELAHPFHHPGGTLLALGDRAFAIALTDAETDQPVALSDYLSVSIRLTEVDGDPSMLSAMRWDATAKRWVELPTVADGGFLTFHADRLSLFGLFDLPPHAMVLSPGPNHLVFTGADGTRTGDYAARLGIPAEDISRLLPHGQAVPLDEDDRLEKGEPLLVVARKLRVVVPTFLAQQPAVRFVQLRPGLNALALPSREPVQIDDLLYGPGRAVQRAFYYDPTTQTWLVRVPAGPRWLSHPFPVAPFTVVFVVAATPTQIAIPDALLGHAR